MPFDISIVSIVALGEDLGLNGTLRNNRIGSIELALVVILRLA